MLLAARAACTVRGIERVAPILGLKLRGIEVRVHGVRRDVSPRIESIRYEVLVDTDEDNRRQALLDENIRKYGTVYSTLSPGTGLAGTVQRAPRS